MATNTFNDTLGSVTASTSTTLTSNGTTGPYALDFEYATVFDVEVFVDEVLKTRTTDYTFTSATQITFTNAPSNGATILIQRNTNTQLPTFFSDGSVLSATELNNVNKQLLHSIQELVDDYVKRDGSITIKASLVFEGSTDDNNETTLAITNPTADRTITLPDTTGTVVTTGDTGTVSSTMITDGTIVNADINASAAIAGSKLQAASGSNPGSMSASDKSKLDGIETGATADQTDSEIKTAYENNSNTNAFTDAEQSKLNGIASGAEVNVQADFNETDNTNDAFIKNKPTIPTNNNQLTNGAGFTTNQGTVTEVSGTSPITSSGGTTPAIGISAATTSAAGSMSSADKTKLDGIETNATADQTDAEIRAAVEAASDSNVFTDADHTKLNGIEASADVTDATNVDAAGAVMNSDLDTKGEILVGDGAGDPTALSVGQNNYVLIADSNEASGVKWGPAPSAGGLNNIVEDTSPQLGGALDVQAQEINTSTTNGNIKLNPNGTGVVEVKGDGSSADGTIQLNCSQNSHGVKIKSPPHSANASYTLTLPNNDGNAGQFLKTDGSGVLSFDDLQSTRIVDSANTSNIVALGSNGHFEISGNNKLAFDRDTNNANKVAFQAPSTQPNDITFTLPAADGSNGQFLKTDGSGVLSFGTIDLTALSATNLTSGTIPDARFPATLPTASAANLTSIPAANITGTLPAISGANLTDLDAADLASGTIPDARFPATLPAISATNLTNIPAANITGTLPAIDGSNLTGITASNSNTLDNLDSTQFLRSDANDTATGELTFNAGISTNGKDLYLDNGALIVSDSDGAFSDRTGSNIDHIWHNEGDNAWIFNSDEPYKATTGTSKLRCAGIDFGDTNNSDDILDEYEEGTWTPQLRIGGSTSGISYGSNRGGSYVRVGRMVTVNFSFGLSQFTNTGSGDAEIDGLPFGVNHYLSSTTLEASGCSAYFSNLDDGHTFIGFAANDSNDRLEIKGTDGDVTGMFDLNQNDFKGNTSLRGSITYFTST